MYVLNIKWFLIRIWSVLLSNNRNMLEFNIIFELIRAKRSRLMWNCKCWSSSIHSWTFMLYLKKKKKCYLYSRNGTITIQLLLSKRLFGLYSYFVINLIQQYYVVETMPLRLFEIELKFRTFWERLRNKTILCIIVPIYIIIVLLFVQYLILNLFDSHRDYYRVCK